MEASENKDESPQIDEIFSMIQVRVERNPSGIAYIRMRLISKLGSHFFTDVQMSRRGLRWCKAVAERLKLEMYIEPAALELMNACE